MTTKFEYIAALKAELADNITDLGIPENMFNNWDEYCACRKDAMRRIREIKSELATMEAAQEAR